MIIEINRRNALKTFSSCLGSLAFAALATGESIAQDAATNPLAPKETHFKARAKRVVVLFMSGAPSHVDTFDYKPKLNSLNGKTSDAGASKLLGSQWKFKQRGKSGLWISDLFPNMAKHADELCLLRGMHCDQPSHAQAKQAAHTGTPQFIRPALGAWSVYGLGTENANLPGFVSLGAGAGANFGSAFLPAAFQATEINTGVRSGGGRRSSAAGGPTVPNINPLLDRKTQRDQLDFMQQLNRAKLERDQHQPQVEGIIQSYELAFRMQATMPEVVDLSQESAKTKEQYGIGESDTNTFGTQCLTARRMLEAGVRFVELNSTGWDHHNDLKAGMETQSKQVDKPVAALIADLKQRGMLEDTLIIWAGEFGRTPHGENGDGRGHNNRGYTTIMIGGGVKGGFSYGATDELGYEAVEGKMHTHDWHATILHLLGLDHKRLTYRHAGRDFRLTDVHGNVAKDILA